MPELPEVETVRRLIEPRVIGRTIRAVEVTYWRMVKSDHASFISTLVGRTFAKMKRVGKFLIFTFDDDLILISHLRMEGKYIDLTESEPDSRYARVIFHLNDGTKICYDDSRCFGTMQLSRASVYMQEPPLSEIGPEPFDISDPTYLLGFTKRSARPIKELLLDQTIMTGLGNIYVDEVLYLSKIHPELPSNLLTISEAGRLLDHSREVLGKAIIAGGSTIRTYHAAKGVDGKFQQQLYAYGRVGKPCSFCHTPLAKIKVKGRGSTYCPRCQINRAKPIVIGITGLMHAGKSTLLDSAKSLGYPTLSSDALVKQLYAEPGSAEKISSLLKLDFSDGIIESRLMLETILGNPTSKKRLEKWVHPIIKERVVAFINTQTSTHVFIEVPLLFDANWDYMCQYIIGVTAPSAIIKERITNAFAHPDLALRLAETNQFPAYQNRVDDLIVNDGTLEEFKEKAIRAIKRSIQAAHPTDL